MVIFAAIADLFDGMAARLLKVSSPIGKELDSLADMVSFGVVPGMMVFNLIPHDTYKWIGLCIPVFAALRLAKFNIDTRQTKHFIGVPTPAIALLIASFPFIMSQSDYWSAFYSNMNNVTIVCTFFSILAFVCSALMVSPIRLISMKAENLSWGVNKARYILVLMSIIAIVLFQFSAVPIIMLFYIVISLLANPAKEEHE